MNNLLSSAAAGLTPAWLQAANSQAALKTDPEVVDKSGVQDLIDPRQVALFDALEQLSNISAKTGIQVPQLVVVGDQSSGKSSVLEAIGRFHFPVNDELCTRFPTKLIMRRSPKEWTQISIEPSASRSEEDRKRLLQFRGHLSGPDEFGEWVRKAAVELGVVPPTSAFDAPSNGGLSTMDGSADVARNFTDDVLVVKRYGPGLPLVDLVDLPGLFQAESNEQDRASKQTVIGLVEEHIKCKRNLILLVVSARTNFHNHAGPAVIQTLAKHDPGLAHRVVGVMTSPDRALSVSESKRVLSGRLSSSDLNIYRWHVVKNQDQKERNLETLVQRNEKEATFFLNDPDWRDVSESQRGIDALRVTLRNVFWHHTRAALPGLISEIESRIRRVHTRLSAAGQARTTDAARRKYLRGIARKFELITREACQGTYQDETCKASHRVGEECPGCKPFFASFGEDTAESRDKHLRANIRTLSKAFAFAMREYGKTKDVKPDHNNSAAASARAEASTPARGLPAKAVMKDYYTHQQPEVVGQKAFEKWLTTELPRWRGREPQGVASETVYHGLFEYQSRKWKGIAAKHLEAVWKAVGRFVKAALAAACPDADVRQALRDSVMQPRLEQLKMASHRAMSELLACHGRGNTGFYDGFVNVGPMQWREKELARRVLAWLPETGNVEARQQGKGASGLSADKVFDFVRDLNGYMALMQTGGVIGPKFLREVERVVRFSEAFRTTGVAANWQGEGKPDAAEQDHNIQGTFGLVPDELEAIAAAHATQQVEMYYEMSMMSFVGYVNSLVVENGILGELPTAILTQERVMDEDMDPLTVEKVAGESASEAVNRKKDENESRALQSVLETLRGYMGPTSLV